MTQAMPCISGAFNKGLYMLNLSDFSVAQIHTTNSLLQKPIRSIVKLSPERLAIGIDGSGVLAYNAKDNSLTTFVNTELAPEFSFTGNGIYALLNDGNGNLWIGSYTGGVTMVSLSQSPIQIITHIKRQSQLSCQQQCELYHRVDRRKYMVCN